MKHAPKRQYARHENAPLIRIQVLLPRPIYQALEQWKRRTHLPKSDLINRAIARELEAEAKRRR